MFWHRLSALSIRTLHPSTLFNRTGVLAQNCLENIPTGRTNFFSFFPIHAYYLSEMKLKADRHLCGKSESLLCRMAVLMMVMMSTQEPPLQQKYCVHQQRPHISSFAPYHGHTYATTTTALRLNSLFYSIPYLEGLRIGNYQLSVKLSYARYIWCSKSLVNAYSVTKIEHLQNANSV